MEHYIAYHSAHTMGREYESHGGLNFLSKKPGLLRKAIGNTVWVIQGVRDGRKTLYTLVAAHIADSVVPESLNSDIYEIHGRQGLEFVTPVPLNELSWFPALLKSQSNFSLGFNRLSDQSVILGLAALRTEHASVAAAPVPDSSSSMSGENSPEFESDIEEAASTENTVEDTDSDNWYSESDYRQALVSMTESITPVQRRMLVAHAEAPDCILSVRQLAAAGGYANSNVTYSQYGRLAHLIANSLGVEEEWKVWTFFIGQDIRTEDNELLWEMHPELVAALVSLGWASREHSSLEDIADVADPSTPETIRTAIIQARIGQEQFRGDLVRRWGKCVVTGVSEPAVLRASHIKPWKDAGAEERLDTDNGLLLAAHIDALFDKGLITFEIDGQIRFSPLMANEDLLRLGISSTMRVQGDATGREKYMQYHRTFVFRTGAAPGPH